MPVKSNEAKEPDTPFTKPRAGSRRALPTPPPPPLHDPERLTIGPDSMALPGPSDDPMRRTTGQFAPARPGLAEAAAKSLPGATDLP